MIDYCSNEKLDGVGLHILGVYPDKCAICSKHPVYAKRPVNTYRFQSLKSKPVNSPVTGNDIWADSAERDEYLKTSEKLTELRKKIKREAKK